MTLSQINALKRMTRAELEATARKWRIGPVRKLTADGIRLKLIDAVIDAELEAADAPIPEIPRQV